MNVSGVFEEFYIMYKRKEMNDMKYLRFATSSLLVSSLTLMSVGSALADTVHYDTTGPGSTNTVTINDTSNTTVTNTNDVTIRETVDQTATSGDANASNNTQSGDVATGDASNSSTGTTSVSIGNQAVGGFGGSTGGSGNGAGGSGNGSGAGGSGNGSGTVNGSGNVLGSSTNSVGGFGGGALLPVTGPSSLVDVSALRSLYHPATIVPPAIVKQSKNTSAMFLIAAAILSLLGAFGSAIYANRREQLL
jgi:hypothetical protein